MCKNNKNKIHLNTLIEKKKKNRIIWKRLTIDIFLS